MTDAELIKECLRPLTYGASDAMARDLAWRQVRLLAAILKKLDTGALARGDEQRDHMLDLERCPAAIVATDRGAS